MKLLFLFFVIAILGGITYGVSRVVFGRSKKNKKNTLKPIGISAVVIISLLGLVGFGIYSSSRQPDLQCSTTHAATSKSPAVLQNAMDYFNQGNYDYETGNCLKAIADYTNSIEINPNYPQAYNNRAYTYMRIRDYKDALPDLDKAIQINPNYVQALMNRGDIHNYYYQIDRPAAITDYKRVIALTDLKGGTTSVCGHLFLAEHNGWTFGAYLDFFTGAFAACR